MWKSSLEDGLQVVPRFMALADQDLRGDLLVFCGQFGDDRRAELGARSGGGLRHYGVGLQPERVAMGGPPTRRFLTQRGLGRSSSGTSRIQKLAPSALLLDVPYTALHR